MKVLYIGGSGNISWRCVARSIELGHDVWALNRASPDARRRKLLVPVQTLQADMRSPLSVRQALGSNQFDAIIDFTCFTPEHAAACLDLFAGRTAQYILISSTAAYQKPAAKLPYTEDTPLANPYWPYAQNKAECEKIFHAAWQNQGFPLTVVRPGHTYDTIIPTAVGNADWTIPARLLAGKPIPLHGDGTTLWTLTHSDDFARALVQLIGNPASLGQVFHITSDEWLTWRQIMRILAQALSAPEPEFVFVSSAEIFHRDPWLGQTITGHKAWCDIYDNSRIKKFLPSWQAQIPFSQGIRTTLDWFHQDPVRKKVDARLDVFLNQLCVDFQIKTRLM